MGDMRILIASIATGYSGWLGGFWLRSKPWDAELFSV